MLCIAYALRVCSAEKSALRRTVFAFLLASAIGVAARADVRVQFPGVAFGEALSGFLYRPLIERPAPAIVMLHGCSGLTRVGEPLGLYRVWRELLVEDGYVVLMVDSAVSRGFGQTCTAGKERKRMWTERPSDSYAALAFLQQQSFVIPERIGLMGWSQGGGIVLRTIPEGGTARPTPLPRHDFAAAVAFYPGACSERLQSRPFVDSPPLTWTTRIPLLIFQGEADNWTPAEPCRNFVEAAHARGAAVTMKVYANAVHAFDAPKVPIHAIETYRKGDWVPVIGTDEAARVDAQERARAFLKLYLRAPVKP